MSPAEFDQQYARYLAGEMSEEERIKFERRIASDPELSEEVYADTNLRSAIEPGVIARGPARWWRWAAPLAAAAIIIVGINLAQSPTEEPVMRGGGQSIELLAPVGPVDSVPTRFEWRPVEGATSYRFELMDESARIIHRGVVNEPFIEIGSGVPAKGAWRVVAVDDLARELATSAPVRFELGE